MLGKKDVFLSSVFGQQFPTVHFEFNGGLNQTWIILQHLVEPLIYKVLLDIVANVRQSTGPNVSTRTLEGMCD